jgi:hypothetical protein
MSLPNTSLPSLRGPHLNTSRLIGLQHNPRRYILSGIRLALYRRAAAPSAPKQVHPQVEPALSPILPARIPEAFTPPVTSRKVPASGRVSAVQESARPCRNGSSSCPTSPTSSCSQSLRSSTGSGPGVPLLQARLSLLLSAFVCRLPNLSAFLSNTHVSCQLPGTHSYSKRHSLSCSLPFLASPGRTTHSWILSFACSQWAGSCR